jgi:ribosomal protein L28
MFCYHCGKGVLYGRSHTHHRGVAGGRWKKRAPKTQRIFSPNLQSIEVMENGEERRVKLCMKCLKRIKKDMNEGKKPFLELVNYTVEVQPEAKEAQATA